MRSRAIVRLFFCANRRRQAVDTPAVPARTQPKRAATRAPESEATIADGEAQRGVDFALTGRRAETTDRTNSWLRAFNVLCGGGENDLPTHAPWVIIGFHARVR